MKNSNQKAYTNTPKTKKSKKHRKKRSLPLRILRGVFMTLFILMILGGAAGAGIVSAWISSAPDLDTINIAPSGYATYIYDSDGNQMQKLTTSNSNRIAVSLNEVPEDLQHAVVAIEDERFYQHGGIDLRGILRAAWVTLKSGGSSSQGASTITQQLIKNNVLTGWTEEKTFLDKIKRKVQEQYLAVALEKKIRNKYLILENYLNTINLGAGTYGVQAASRKYFNKDVTELTLSESTVIAGITQNPSKYNPIRHPEENAARRERVLTKMLEQGYITQEEKDECLADPVYDRIAEAQEETRKVENTVYSWFVDQLTKEVVRDLEEKCGYSETQAYQLLYSGGLRIYTTQDQEIQAIADEEYAADTNMAEGTQSSLVIIDQATGYVTAIVGGSEEKTASLTLNRATGIRRQPGSTFKILSTYAPAIDHGVKTIGSYVKDEPYTYADGTEVHNAEGSYEGWITLREAIVHSVNVAAVKVITEITPDIAYQELLNFGITTLDETNDRGQALALGGLYKGVTNLELTAAYAAIANGGTYTKPVFYKTITDMNGNMVIDNTQPETEQVISEDTAWILTDAMKGVITEGTAKDVQLASAMPVAGKTGTTTSYRDLWFVGYTPYYTMGVWYGYDDNSVIEKEGNSRIAHKLLWKRIMDRIAAKQEIKDFPQPATVRQMETCGISNLLPSETCSLVSNDYVSETYIPLTICDVDGNGKLAGGETAGSGTTTQETATDENGTDLFPIGTTTSTVIDAPTETPTPTPTEIPVATPEPTEIPVVPEENTEQELLPIGPTTSTVLPTTDDGGQTTWQEETNTQEDYGIPEAETNNDENWDDAIPIIPDDVAAQDAEFQEAG